MGARERLGSTSITTDSNGAFGSEIRYYPWGGRRYANGSIPTTFQYTGQRLDSGIGLYFYGARYYDPAAGRFIQPDTMVPQQQGVQAWDRYAYVGNNPLRYTDPSGHKMVCEPEDPNCNQEAKHEELNNSINPQPIPTPKPSPSTTPVPEPIPTYSAPSLWALQTQSAVIESQPHLSAPPMETPCKAPPYAEGLDLAEALKLLREISGELDPFTPDAFTGTTTGFGAMITYASGYIRITNPNSTIPKILEIIPAASFVYSFTYDHIVDSGEYSDLPITFQTVAYTIILTSVYLSMPSYP